ncbi:MULTISPECIES: DNA mismatch repair protein MutS [unclassified Sporosarcina]|uniref:DNA mismatch repair protein MutS n=1 Tax=unclassified Sporosarcina TaxID=2647733 RepID=UPI00204057BA|nr:MULTISPECIES: DNA mismatch repair protein MutS [unclassified Sporosarcina]GKV64116.1 DNA mismatch repair protein MutS [Sporosarcina sp. NCCP-2331]GLB54419.1 DNA mismatch repair protein MutS [Sporosarcina sp. NCCP-2378]
MSEHTPMIKQYLQIKEQHKDAFLFFRLGDFYEMFFEDALNASSILEITLTSRDSGSKDRIPMCGIPYHSAAGYIETLIQKGHKVAICEQMEDPRSVKGIVKREVVKVVTPGTLTEGKTIDTEANHFIGAVHNIADQRFALAYLDVGTGEGKVELIEGTERSLLAEIESLGMKEIVVDQQLHLALHEMFESREIMLSIEDTEQLQTIGQDTYAHLPAELQEACRKLQAYLLRMQKMVFGHIRPFVYIEKDAKLSIDANSMRNLELVQTIRSGKKEGTLFWVLDETVTAMGARKLRMWIHQPLAQHRAIEDRLEAVSNLVDEYFLREELVEELKNVYDLERLAGRISMGSASARDLAQLRNSLTHIPKLKQILDESQRPMLQKLAEQMDPCKETYHLLADAIAENPPLSGKDGGLIKDGYHDRLDQLRDASRNGKNWLAQLEQKERQATGIKTLKIGYNRIFGYYIEITKSNIHLADLSRYERKQTLANAERYITAELKEKEELILNAEADSQTLETELFSAIRDQVKNDVQRIQRLASVISELDVLLSFAAVSEKNQYVRPEFHEGRALHIQTGRHPVVEKMMNHSLYIPNSCELAENSNMLLITGPNMSGKSTYMRQVALTVVMAQIGCFVPCEKAMLPITDQIFTRIGAADDVASGQSTFMMEMMESQYALAHASSRSLLLFDEIGRGTSTYDGMALAQAMMEHIHEEIQANTLFSTHYHELTKLEDVLARLTNVHVAAKEQNGKVVFLHKVLPGAADKSYGIHVAELAGLPKELVGRAKDLLYRFEEESAGKDANSVSEQLALFDSFEGPAVSHEKIQLLEEIEATDIMNMTPMQAMQKLAEWKTQLAVK